VICRERICERQERTARGTFALGEIPTDEANWLRMSITHRLRYQCVGDHLAHPYSGKLCAQAISQRGRLWTVAWQVTARERWNNLIIAIEASNLLRNVRFELNVPPPRGNGG
jgi:hypothetical protein